MECTVEGNRKMAQKKKKKGCGTRRQEGSEDGCCVGGRNHCRQRKYARRVIIFIDKNAESSVTDEFTTGWILNMQNAV